MERLSTLVKRLFIALLYLSGYIYIHEVLVCACRANKSETTEALASSDLIFPAALLDPNDSFELNTRALRSTNISVPVYTPLTHTIRQTWHAARLRHWSSSSSRWRALDSSTPPRRMCAIRTSCCCANTILYCVNTRYLEYVEAFCVDLTVNNNYNNSRIIHFILIISYYDHFGVPHNNNIQINIF
jgi:hypothetical protein